MQKIIETVKTSNAESKAELLKELQAINKDVTMDDLFIYLNSFKIVYCKGSNGWYVV